MRLSLALVVLGALGVLATAPSGADVTTCSLSGDYAVAAALHLAEGAAQLTGRFTFTPPGSCTPSAPGTVQVALSVLVAGSLSPLGFNGSFPYAVDGAGSVVIPGLLRGVVAGVSGDDVANVLVFEGDVGPIVRFAGTAVRADLTGVAGPAGPPGPPGPPGAAVLSVYDSIGVRLGGVVSLSGSIGNGLLGTVPVIVLPTSGGAVGLRVLRDRLEGNIDRLLFASLDCSGPPLVEFPVSLPPQDIERFRNEPIVNAMVSGPGIVVYVQDVSINPSSVTLGSFALPDGNCLTSGGGIGGSLLLWPTRPPIDLTTQFTPPFTVQ